MKEEKIAKVQGQWSLKRMEYVFPNLSKVQLQKGAHVTYTELVPAGLVSENTKAVIISVSCMFWNLQGYAYMDLSVYQKGNEEAGAAKLTNRHFNVHSNNFYYEIMVPWHGHLSREFVFKITDATIDGSSSGMNLNFYQVKMLGTIGT